MIRTALAIVLLVFSSADLGARPRPVRVTTAPAAGQVAPSDPAKVGDEPVDVVVDKDHGDFLVLSVRQVWNGGPAIVATPVRGATPAGDPGIVLSTNGYYTAWSVAPAGARGPGFWFVAWFESDGVHAALLRDDGTIEHRALVLPMVPYSDRLIVVKTAAGFALAVSTLTANASIVFFDAEGKPSGAPRPLVASRALDAIARGDTVIVAGQEACAGAHCSGGLLLERARAGEASTQVVKLGIEHPSASADQTVRIVDTREGLMLLRAHYPGVTQLDTWIVGEDGTPGSAASHALPMSTVYRIWAVATSDGVRLHFIAPGKVHEVLLRRGAAVDREAGDVAVDYHPGRRAAVGIGRTRSLVLHRSADSAPDTLLLEAGRTEPVAAFVAMVRPSLQRTPWITVGSTTALIQWSFGMRIVSRDLRSAGPIIGAGRWPDVPAAFGGGVYLVPFAGRLARFAEDGTRLGNDVSVPFTFGTLRFDGSVFLVLQADSDKVMATRVTVGGEVVDPVPLVIRATGSYHSNIRAPGAATNDRGVTLLAWTERGASCGKACSYYEVKGAAIDRNGSVVGAPFTIIPDNESVTWTAQPLVTAIGDSWAVALAHSDKTQVRRVSAAFQVSGRVDLPAFSFARDMVTLGDTIVIAADAPRAPYRVLDARTQEVQRSGFLAQEQDSREPALAVAGDRLLTAWITTLWNRPYSGSTQVFAALRTP